MQPKTLFNIPTRQCIAGLQRVGILRGFLLLKKMTTNQNKESLTTNQILYRQYLSSPEWKRKKDAVFERENGICQGCKDEPIEHVHHATYTHQYDELLFQLVGLCENCHRKVHFTVPSWNPWKPIV